MKNDTMLPMLTDLIDKYKVHRGRPPTRVKKRYARLNERKGHNKPREAQGLAIGYIDVWACNREYGYSK